MRNKLFKRYLWLVLIGLLTVCGVKASGVGGLAPMPALPPLGDALPIRTVITKTAYNFHWKKYAWMSEDLDWEQKRDFRFYTPAQVQYYPTFQAGYTEMQDWNHDGAGEYFWQVVQRYYFSEILVDGTFYAPHLIYEKTQRVYHDGDVWASNWTVLEGGAQQNACDFYLAERAKWYGKLMRMTVDAPQTQIQPRHWTETVVEDNVYVDPTDWTWDTSQSSFGTLWIGDAVWSVFRDDLFYLNLPTSYFVGAQEGWSFLIDQSRVTDAELGPLQ